ncbi:GNAT family N-acetyltransferase [Paractinoplanes rhizophilus]|jgi:GNAT superfamily N-acetyltransferase|uniref:GNAT family N-acetyltransferase n=1 Tax=Paractinoplanes rhizophilus TaxID=1416877 RepID=A0ABW2HXI0_9ACTN|nr:GNAT family N-acetyltransferase [Actinoplanes sp.]
MIARLAVPDDADELVRLRAVMLRSLHAGSWTDDWRKHARATLIDRLAAGTMAAFVVDRPEATGLASCALGVIEERLGGPGNPFGRSGYVFSVATDEDMRRRGFSRACMTALLDWFRDRGVTKVDLRASPSGEPLYRSLGFERTPDPAMRLRF